MGWYLRKAFRVGPLRLNLSKSGLGFSAGVKGARVGIGPRGGYLHAGREGLYYRRSLGSSSPRRSRRSAAPLSFSPVVFPEVPPHLASLRGSLAGVDRFERISLVLLLSSLVGVFLHPVALLVFFVACFLVLSARRLRRRVYERLPSPGFDLTGSVLVLDAVFDDGVLVDGRTFELRAEQPGIWSFASGRVRVVEKEFWLEHADLLSATRLPYEGFAPGEALFADLPEGFRFSTRRPRHQRVDGSPDRRFSENPELFAAPVEVLDLGSGVALLRPV